MTTQKRTDSSNFTRSNLKFTMILIVLKLSEPDEDLEKQVAWIKDYLYVDHPRLSFWWVAPFYKELIPATKKIRDLTPKLS